MCTTVVLAPGLQPRLVLKYKSVSELRKLRAHVDEVRAHPWGGVANPDSSDDDGGDSEGGASLKGTSEPSPAADSDLSDSDDGAAVAGELDDGPYEPEKSSYWSDYATAVYGVDPLARLPEGADTYGAEVHVLKVARLTDAELALPPSFCGLLGTTQTLHFTHTERTDLTMAVLKQLMRHTLGHWSHWGLLDSIRLYLPSEGVTLTLVDVPGYSPSLLPFRKEAQDWAFNSCRFSSLVHSLHCSVPSEQNHPSSDGGRSAVSHQGAG